MSTGPIDEWVIELSSLTIINSIPQGWYYPPYNDILAEFSSYINIYIHEEDSQGPLTIPIGESSRTITFTTNPSDSLRITTSKQESLLYDNDGNPTFGYNYSHQRGIVVYKNGVRVRGYDASLSDINVGLSSFAKVGGEVINIGDPLIQAIREVHIDGTAIMNPDLIYPNYPRDNLNAVTGTAQYIAGTYSTDLTSVHPDLVAPSAPTGYVIKTDLSGANILWAMPVIIPTARTTKVTSIHTYADAFYITGTFTTVTTPIERRGFIRKYNLDGIRTWERHISSPTTQIEALVATSNNFIIHLGLLICQINDPTAIISIHDPQTGGLISTATYPRPNKSIVNHSSLIMGFNLAGAVSMDVTPIVLQSTLYDNILTDMKVVGITLYLCGYIRGNDPTNQIVINAAEPSPTRPLTTTSPPINVRAGYLIKYNANGRDIYWTKQLTGSLNPDNYYLSIDANDSFVCVVGRVGYETPIGPDLSDILVLPQVYAAALITYNNDGSLRWAKKIDSAGEDSAFSVSVSGMNVYLSGYFTGEAYESHKNGQSGSVTLNQTYIGTSQTPAAFLMKYDYNGALVYRRILKASTTAARYYGYSVMAAGSYVSYMYAFYQGYNNPINAISFLLLKDTEATPLPPEPPTPVPDREYNNPIGVFNVLWPATSTGGPAVDTFGDIETSQLNPIFITKVRFSLG
jgi:hypothetical protein